MLSKEQAVELASNSKVPIKNVPKEDFDRRLTPKQPVEPAATTAPEPTLKPREASIKLTPEQDQALLDAETKYNNMLI